MADLIAKVLHSAQGKCLYIFNNMKYVNVERTEHHEVAACGGQQTLRAKSDLTDT